MQTLLIDVGNSRLKWGLASGGVLQAQDFLVHNGEPAAVINAIPAAAVEAIWVANVTGVDHAQQLAAALDARYQCTAHFARSHAECEGLRVAYAQPERLGVDRWLNMLALWMQSRSAFGVASAGTALTFDAVDAGGQHLGGIIAPGLIAAQQAVLQNTRFAAAAPDFAFEPGLGTDTESCVRQGALHAAAGLLDRLADRHVPPPARLVLGGGDAPLLLPHLSPRWVAAPDLVLEGLMRLAAVSA